MVSNGSLLVKEILVRLPCVRGFTYPRPPLVRPRLIVARPKGRPCPRLSFGGVLHVPTMLRLKKA